jgi:pyruvate carboxylase
LKEQLEKKWGKDNIRDVDLLSAALYPKVFDEFQSFKKNVADISVLPTRYAYILFRRCYDYFVDDLSDMFYLHFKLEKRLASNWNMERL